MAEAQTATDMNGQYAFTGLRSGTYSVEISGFDSDEVGFGSVSSAATVGVGESKIISFDGTYLRTAGIMGQVSVEGEGLAGVTVTMTGEGEDQTEVTDAGGLYGFSKLKAGTYSIAISGYDPDAVEFGTTSMNVTVALGETANVPFEGTLLRTSGISGRVSLDDGTGLDGVTVTLAGAAEATQMTTNGGQYAFAGLAEGTYVVTISGWDEVAYNFDEKTTATIVLGDAVSHIENFPGTHTRTASISGKLFIDEAPADGMYTANEPAFMHAGIPVALQGPGVNDLDATITGEDGTYSFPGLIAGDYRVLVDYNETVAAMFAAGGFSFKGELTGTVVSVDPGGTGSANFPVGITMQTISVSANMGSAEGAAVPGVELALYANADMTGMLDEQTTGPTGHAVFNFARADNTGPGGNDNLVFVNMKSVGADNTGLEASGNEVIEVSYPGTARTHAAGAAVTLLNTAVNIQFSVKSNKDARGGDMGLEGWATEYCTPMADDAATTDADESVVCTGEDATFTAMTDADGEPALTDADGKGTLSFTADVDNLPAMVYVRAAIDQDDKLDYGETYGQTDGLMHSHDGLILPADNDPAMNEDLDKGAIYITYTTQSIYVGAHRELDDRTGLTDYIGVGEGDARPSGHAKGKIKVRLMKADDRGRLEQYTYDHDNDPLTDDADAEKTFSDADTVRFKYVDATAKIVVVAAAGSNMTIVPNDRSAREIDAYGDRLDNFPDGIMAGAFGEGSGGRPDVWICPLQRQEDAEENCSTFAYKWEDGEISGAVGGLQEDDEDVVVALTPVRSNDEYSSDLEDDTEIDFDEDGPTEYSFDGIADGKYRVVLEGREGQWQRDSTVVITIQHDESKTGAEFDTGADEYEVTKNLSATQLRYAIQGMVGNDRSDPPNSLARSETRAGVTLNLHYASKKKAKAPNKNTRTMLGAVMDADGKAMTAETNSDGEYEFTGLRSDTVYVVAAVSEEGHYKVVRKRGSLQAESKDNMYSQAVVKAKAPDPEYPGDAASPSWDHATGKMTAGGDPDFALLFEDGTVEGVVSDPSPDSAHQETEVELYRCLEAPPGAPADVNECGSLVPAWPVVIAKVEEDGDWFVEGLLEGHYEVALDMPAGFDNSTETGSRTGANGTAGYYESQVASLTDGARASADMEDFHIVNHRADAGVENPTALVEMGSVVLAGEGDLGTTENDFVPFDTRSVTLTLTNGDVSQGATLKVGATSFTEEEAGTWGLDAGDNPLMVLVKSANGYATSSPGDNGDGPIPTAPPVDIHRDRDTRLKTLELDGNGADSPDDDVLRRARLEAITRFVSSEELQSERIAGVESADGATVNLGTVSIDKATTQVILSAEAMSATGVAVSFEGTGETAGTIPFDATDTVTQTVTVTITIVDDGAGVDTDDGRALNTRSYAITFSQPKGS